MNEVTVKWIAEDIKGLYPDWSDDKCEEVLDEISRHLQNRVIELGNEVLELLTNEWDLDNQPEEEEDNA